MSHMERLSELVKSQKRGNLHFCEYIEQLLSNEKYEQASTLCLGELEKNYNNSQVFMLLGKALRCQSQCNDAENAFLYAINWTHTTQMLITSSVDCVEKYTVITEATTYTSS